MAHYVRVCRGARSVLELGSGAGRLLAALAEPGRSLFGLDYDGGLLGLCRKSLASLSDDRRRGVTLVQADMRTFDLGRRFERILLPYNALYCLLREEDVSRCFRTVRRALEPGGVFAFDVWCSDGLDVKDLRESRDDEPLTQFEHGGRSWSVFERCEVARGRDRLDVIYTYVPSGAANARQQTLPQRYYRSERLFALLERAGFEVRQKYGTFGGARFGPRSRRLVVTASAAGRAAR